VNVGRIAVGFIVVMALLGGTLLYYTQVYAYYQPVAFQPGAEILLTPLVGGVPEPILAEDVSGIDGDSSPIRFRACFTTPMTLAMLSETYRTYERAEPLNAPGWFDCFDAAKIGAALETGEAIAFLSQAGVHPGVDRVVAVFPDGRAFAWQQLAADGSE
jgi:hypothetical protein